MYVTPYYEPTGVKAFHNMNIKGKGVKLGIIDSGINYNNPAFKKNRYYFKKFVEIKGEDLSKCNSHGINLAGIAAGETDYFTGVAPEATLGSYRVFGCKGPTSTSLVLQALTTAVQYDKMEIIVLPEIAIVDKYSIELRETIEVAARQGVIMIVAATTNNFMNQQYFSYQGLSVLSVGGARQDYRPMHWFEEKQPDVVLSLCLHVQA
ncbi:peptidase S8/S53 domain-containing protein [Syncephalis fuscata]|nr:peptidase S8/S53 domain-containing protein [Syncephalis fuscata]